MFNPDDYQLIFNARAGAYHAAMQQWPSARRIEFSTLLKDLPYNSDMRIIDIPAGGGYLAKYFPDDVNLYHLETSELFAKLCASSSDYPTSLCTVEALPISDDSIDLAASLAGLHHIEDKEALFSEIFRTLKPGGRIRIADAHAHSPTAKFLDGWMAAHNSMGHQGSYLDDSTVALLRSVGFSDIQAANENYHWHFHDQADAAAYCKELFGIDLAEIEDVQAALSTHLGFITPENGGVGLNWQLFYIAASKPRVLAI